MRIGIDCRLWNQTGVGRYIRNLIINLLEIDDNNQYVLFVMNEDAKEIKDQISKSKIKNQKSKIIPTNIKWHSITEQLKFPKMLEKEKLDLMHFTYQQSVPIFYKRPYIMTIHDLIKHHFVTGKIATNPYWLIGFKMLAYKLLINSAAKRAKKIIAVSNFTREEIFDHLIVNKRKVEVIYEAADDFNYHNNKKTNIGKYFLFVGNVYPHKNVDKMLKAFRKLMEYEDVKLVFVGNDDIFYKELKDKYSRFIDQGKVIVHTDLQDSDLGSYYANAICLIRPSLMEGFSLPPLEAMKCGCLVLASDIPVHKEIFGDNIFYFNPNDFVDIEAKMNYVLNLSEKLRTEKIHKGKKLAEKFSWESVARQTLKIYESCTSVSSV